jgi:hypothetical protein
MRLRVLDINTPWFWLTVFWQRLYGKPWLEMSIWSPNTHRSWWFYAFQWEKYAEGGGGYGLESPSDEKLVQGLH